MIYKKYGQTGKKVSAIGFGGMRFPNDCSIEDGAKVVRRASELGINYFDTAPFYCDDRSEDIMGEAFKDMPNPFYVSTKSGIGSEPDEGAVRKRVEKSLERLGVEKINFYHMWCVMNMEHYRKVMAPGGPYWGALKAKEEGLIEHIVISTHATGEEIATIMREGYFEGVTLGYNIVNFPYRQQGIQAAHELGLGVVTMNPLGGGLIPQNQDYFSFIKERENESVIQAALRFNAAHEAITVALSGMGSIEEVEHNVKAIQNLKILSDKKIKEVKENLYKGMDKLCTKCEYCKKCPQNIDIPKFMEIYNTKVLKGSEAIKDRYEDSDAFNGDEPMPADCIACGKCEKLCTQHLDIIDRLQWLDENIVKE